MKTFSGFILTWAGPRPQLQFIRLRDAFYMYDQRWTLAVNILEILMGTLLSYYTAWGVHVKVNSSQLALMYLFKPDAYNGYLMKTFNVFYLLSLFFHFASKNQIK